MAPDPGDLLWKSTVPSTPYGYPRSAPPSYPLHASSSVIHHCLTSLGFRSAWLRYDGLVDQTTVYNNVHDPWSVDGAAVPGWSGHGRRVLYGRRLEGVPAGGEPDRRHYPGLWAIVVLGYVGTYTLAAWPLDEGLVWYVLEQPGAMWFVGQTFIALTGLVFKEGTSAITVSAND
ncbi:hypothetical protein D1007_39506 [Hordeum vulgare]|nr:hypothetical protein D1007_39506 [Hordeum vulgare]